MKCARCGRAVEELDHRFFVGTFEHPSEVWVIRAPLYFRATPDFRAVERAYCSAGCSDADRSR